MNSLKFERHVVLISVPSHSLFQVGDRVLAVDIDDVSTIWSKIKEAIFQVKSFQGNTSHQKISMTIIMIAIKNRQQNVDGRRNYSF